ncbi:Gfo/Idh/MocA family protein [Adhaeretor mobilis]|uniref:Alpha-N-acetylgalactosaminidase n=1 Tax=Adhaeretor mobilis TaxID=1930276 RepID=A0A517MYD2_9BACT|nr:Gfo/Idh/MocA family oxidoreductase [Adhaeretor mobilis]QDS99898.1 Alpha-N-acetylgalactosaminidase [Adhaeretor mobilis]
MAQFNRRSFLQTTGGALATGVMASTARAEDANSKIGVAVLGLNGRGQTHLDILNEIDGVEIVALCDPDSKVLADKATWVEEKTGKKPALEADMRKIFERSDVDAVSVATPNHWHSLATIWACQAGKDVYVEKPGSHNIFEGRKMVEAAKKYKRIVQHGVQMRSSDTIQEAVDHLRKGTIGDVYMARGLVYRWRPSVGNQPDSQAPENLDWNLWQGPATEREFSKRYVHYNWHWHWDYGNGDVGNQGVHQTDMCLWGLDVGLPSKINAMGGKFLWDDDKETPEQLTTNYLYPESNQILQFEVRPWITNSEAGASVGNIFYGSEGYLVVQGYGGYEIFLGRKNEPGPKRKSEGELTAHFQNWVDAIRSRDAGSLNGPVETAHTSSALAHLGNISYRLNRQLEFDPATEKFPNDEEANRLLTREYRAPFIVPETV